LIFRYGYLLVSTQGFRILGTVIILCTATQSSRKIRTADEAASALAFIRLYMIIILYIIVIYIIAKSSHKTPGQCYRIYDVHKTRDNEKKLYGGLRRRITLYAGKKEARGIFLYSSVS